MNFYPISTFGTLGVIILAYLLHLISKRIIESRGESGPERYRHRKFVSTIIFVVAILAIGALWSRLLQQKSTFFGILGAGLAIALREPLLAIAGRIAIFAGHMYTVGDRIEINKMGGDVIDIGFFYTRLMEIGNWVKADQVTGRITQFSNSIIFGTPVFNYTQNFSYIWDEIVIAITYDSNFDAATKILLDAADQYTREFLKTAESEIEKMRHSFVVPGFELKPSVFTNVTDNYVELTLRYIVDPKKRRAAKSFIFDRTLACLKKHDDITMGSTTMDLTVRHPDDPNSTERQDSDRPQAA
jgi:small-conductance mechanosensitive channel